MPGQLPVLVIVRHGHPTFARSMQTANGCVGAWLCLREHFPKRYSGVVQ